MEFLLDSANLEEIKEAIDYFPIVGITSNPSIIKKTAAPKDFYEHIRKIRMIIGDNRSLHVQVVSLDSETQVKEAHRLLKEVDDKVYVKVPVTLEGLKTIRILKEEGINVTATGVYDTMQAYYALAAKADYIAVYVNRMTTFGSDPNELFSNLANRIDHDGLDSKILAAGFHSAGQIRDALNAGSETITTPLDLLKATFNNENVNKAIEVFKKDFEDLYGKGSSLIKMKK